MTIKVRIGNTTPPAEPKPPQATVELKVTKTLAGNLLIDDHRYFDIVINPSESKIITLPKPSADKDVFEYQKDFMYSLFKGGIIENESIQGGPVFGMVESTFPSKGDVDTVQATLYQISEYFKSHMFDDEIAEEYDEHIEDNFVDPPDSETTKYGEIPPYQDTPGGNQIGDPTYTFAGYGYIY